MRSFFTFLLMLFLFACAHSQPSANKHKQEDPEITLAIGYIEKIRDISDDFLRVFKDYLPQRFSANPVFLQTHDVDFNKKEVDWHLGFGGTIFAMKEISEGINFCPMMWIRNCHNSVQIISRGKNKKLHKYKKILIFHNGYPSPLSLTKIYPLKLNQHQLYETMDEAEASAALTKGKVDVIISDNYKILGDKVDQQLPLLTFEEKNISVLDDDSWKVPCRTLFYGPKLSVDDKQEVLSTLEKYPWRNKDYRLGQMAPVNLDRWNSIIKRFDWEKDNLIRRHIKKLNK